MERKLPVLATLVAALDLCREHVAYALKITAPWLLILLITPYILRGLGLDVRALPTDDSFENWEILIAALYFVGWGSIAVLWHWRVLRDNGQSQKAMTLDRRVWLYLWRGILISIVVGGVVFLLAIPIILFAISLSSEFSKSTPLVLMVLCLAFIFSIIASRLSIALPAIALNVANFGLGDAWNTTAGNGTRLFFVTIPPLIPLYLLSWGMDASGLTQGDIYHLSLPMILLHLATQLLQFAFGLLGLAVLSLNYAFFVESRDKGALQET